MILPLSGKKSLKLYFLIFIFTLFIVRTDTTLTKEKKSILEILSGKFNPSEDSTYDIVPLQYATQTGLYIHGEVLMAFEEMAQAAQKNGFKIYINSAIRDFNSQKYIWESKFNGQRLVEGQDLKKTYPNEITRVLKILEYSSMPGTSRHHWGTDIDLGYNKNINQMLTNSAFESGEGLKFYSWMEKNAAKYGFCQPYKESPEKRNSNLKYGYHEEKWHWSYKPLSAKYFKIYRDQAKKLVPKGFAGSSYGENFYMDYVQNIHKDCN
ncbi:MAG: M15 family metallopeptidase [Spirochaetia bacterium]|nr:M15 family metallopeptidase [Spirochaetia bacterium]